MSTLRHLVAATLLAACTAAFAQADAAKKPPAAQAAASAASGAHKAHHGKGHKQMSDADCKAMMDKQHGKEGQSHDKQMADSHCAGMK